MGTALAPYVHHAVFFVLLAVLEDLAALTTELGLFIAAIVGTVLFIDINHARFRVFLAEDTDLATLDSEIRQLITALMGAGLSRDNHHAFLRMGLTVLTRLTASDTEVGMLAAAFVQAVLVDVYHPFFSMILAKHAGVGAVKAESGVLGAALMITDPSHMLTLRNRETYSSMRSKEGLSRVQRRPL